MRSAPPRDVSGPGPVPVLIVDDNPAKRLAVRSVLDPLGYSIVEADSGRNALRCVMEQNFAVILLDVRMPDMDGFETAALIRERRESEMTPIIFITSYVRDEILPTARYVEGAVDFIFAPVPPDELRAKVSVFANLFLRAEALAAKAAEVRVGADRLRLLTDAAPIGIFQTDAENNYVYTNPRWTSITGISAQAALGRDWNTIFGLNQKANLEGTLVQDADRAATTQRFDIQLPGSVHKVVLVTSEPVVGANGSPEGWVGTLADITAEAGAAAAAMAAEEARAGLETQLRQAQKMEAVGQLAGGIAHDFNNILAVVLNYADFVAETLPQSHGGQADLAEIVTAGNRGAELVRQLLAFSRQEIIQPSVIDLNEVVHGMAVLLRRSVGEEIDLVIETEDALSLTLADHGQIEQILLNLVVNARDSIAEGGQITLSTANALVHEGDLPDLNAGRYVRLEVVDSGPGIEPDVIDHIFEPFFTTKPRGEGTGLGLATAYGIVKQANGGIYAESEVGKTTFSVFLPVTRSERDVPPQEAEPESLNEGTILVVEDEAPVRQLIGRILRREGFEVLDAASGAEAVKICSDSSTAIDLLLTDVVMPKMSGPALREIVSPIRPEMRILFMSGYTDELIAKRGVLDEGDALISKPFDAKQLVRRVQEALSPSDTEWIDPDASEVMAAALPGGAHQSGHMVQLYETEAFLVETVADFIGPGVVRGDAALVVATGEHLELFQAALTTAGLDVASEIARGNLVCLEAAATLERFMVDGMPDADRFDRSVGDLVREAGRGGRQVRVYGEMVAVLFQQDYLAAALVLEELWNELATTCPFLLLCAYPVANLWTEESALLGICRGHTALIPGHPSTGGEVSPRHRELEEHFERSRRPSLPHPMRHKMRKGTC